MDKREVEKCAPAEDGTHLNRNRSFKSKQLVRSQAIRESTSPPRTISPSVRDACEKSVNKVNVKVTGVERTGGDSSHDRDVFSYSDRPDRRNANKPVEIQITQGTWDEAPPYEHRGRTKRWLSDSSRESTRDLLSNNPRVACVCGACAACPQCRGRRRRHICTIKQDSGICSDECPECSDPEPHGANNDNRKTRSLEDDQYYCRCPERREKPKSTLSRTDSDDKSEPTGTELVEFIKETLNKNGKDRMTLLKIEKELYALVNDTGRCIVKFPVMTSYGRMLVHRCAALFQLSHHLDHSNKNCVIVSKIGTSGGRIPCTNFKTWCEAHFPPPSPQRHPPDVDNAKSILKRDAHSLDEPSSAALAMNRSKSLEQREREYERVRRRIFSTDNCNQDESQWPWLGPGPVKLLAPEPGRNKLLKVHSLETSAGSGRGQGRGAVSKSHSFGGYEPPPAGRALSRQGDLASSSWRLSPSSSGYKTLSLRSTDSVTPSPTGGGTPEPSCPVTSGGGPLVPVVWAVTDMACVPPGALVIHPQTGRPLTNADGSVYHFDPSNPPVLYDPGEYEEIEQHKIIDQSNEKRRGRLEKQHSFIDHEAEYQQGDQYHYEYDVHDAQENPTEKEPPDAVSPTKVRYEPPLQADFNHKPDTNSEATTEADNQRAYVPPREPKAGIYQDTVYYGPYASLNQGYNAEVQSPSQMSQFIPDMSVQSLVPQAKVAPLLQDPNIRPMSLTNVVYPSMSGYQYVPNSSPCQVVEGLLQDGLHQPVVRYQTVMQQLEEQKVPTPPQPAQDTTFRIDSSYPYAPVDFTAYGSCVDAALQAQPQQRSYSVPYSPAEIPGLTNAMPSVYPLGGVIQPQLIQYPVQYQDAVQWTPVQTQAMCPVVYPQHYAHYNILYPQVMPQAYQPTVCQPIYPLLDNRRKRNSLPSSTRVTPIVSTPEEKPYEKFDRQNSDIAAKINQIKEGMMQREGARRRDDWKRNSGTGILGSYPVNYNGRIAGSTDNATMSLAARAIVNSIQHLQAKNTYHQDRRHEYNNSYQRSYDRPDYRRRYEVKGEINGKGDSNAQDRTCNVPENNSNNMDRTSNNSEKNVTNLGRNNQYKNYEDKNSQDASYQGCNAANKSQESNITQEVQGNATDNVLQGNVKTIQYIQEKMLQCNIQDRIQSNAQDNVVCNAQDRIQNNVPDRSPQSTDTPIQNVPDRIQSNTQDRIVQFNAQDRIVQSNAQDRLVQSIAQEDRLVQSNVQDRLVQSNAQDRILQSNAQDRLVQSNAQDRIVQSNAQDRIVQSNAQDRIVQSNTQEDRLVQSNAQDRLVQSNAQDRLVQSNAQDRIVQSNVQDRIVQSNAQDRIVQSNVQDRLVQSNAQDRMLQSNAQDRLVQSNAQDRIVQSNAQDRIIQTNVQDRLVQSNAQDRILQSNAQNRLVQSNAQDRIVQGNAQDRTQDRSNYQDRNSQELRNYQDIRNYQDNRHYQDSRTYQDNRYENRTQDNRNYQDNRIYQDRGYQGDRPWQDRKYAPRNQGMNPGQYQYRPPYLFRHMTPTTWCRRSPAPVHPGLNHPRRPHPDNRTGRRY